MLNFVDTVGEAVAAVKDGSTVMIGGFGNAGQPFELIDALLESGATDLTVVNNNAGQGDQGLALLIKEGRVKKMICSFPRQSDSWHFDAKYKAGQIELELVPQGNLAERIRAAGAGIGGFFTPTGYGTMLAEGKETRIIDGRGQVFETPIHADVALIKALKADGVGNLVYRKTARNFGPIMAAAAKHTIVQVSEIVPTGALDPENIVTPGIYVNSIVRIDSSGAAPPEPQNRWPEMSLVETSIQTSETPLGRDDLARLVARDIAPGSFVNLGIGQPTLVSNYLKPEQNITLHTENGMLGMGPVAEGDQIDGDLINAGKIPVTELPGASYFHHADSFAIMRGGHLDICVLGAFQVSATGDLANWHTGAPDAIPAVGGAMDLATGAKDVFVMMTLLTREGASKIVESCSYPLTGVGCVTRVYTDKAVFLTGPDGVRVRETFGCTLEELQALMPVPLTAAPAVEH
jgi:3-oxoacid CoA-transferase A subunit/3-oxoacid CoA-transferase B subunit